MKKYLLGVLALILSSNLYADCNKAYAAIGAELKPSYFELALRNIAQAEKTQYSLF